MESLMSTASSVASYAHICYYCKNNQHLFHFRCSHSCCYECLVQVNYKVLKNFYDVLVSSPEVINGKSSLLGCPLQCPESELSLSLRLLNSFAQISKKLGDPEKYEFLCITNLAAGFFSGIKTFFYPCLMCQRIVSQLSRDERSVCEFCIKNILVQQTNYTGNFYVRWKNNFKAISERTHVAESQGGFYAVTFDETKETYQNHPENGYFAIKKYNYEFRKKVVIVRALITKESSDYIYITDFDMIFSIVLLDLE